MKEMSERCLLRLTRMSNMLEYQEGEPQAGQQLFIGPLKKIEFGSFTGQKLGPPDSLQVSHRTIKLGVRCSR